MLIASIAYCFIGVLIGMLVWPEQHYPYQEESPAAAFGFLGGLFWPLTIAFAVLTGLAVVGTVIVRSFAVLLRRGPC